MNDHNQGRRRFFRACLSTAAVVASNPSVLADTVSPARSYNRVLLTKGANTPLRTSDLVAGQALIFNYPFVTTPCFLIDVGSPVEAKGPLQTAGEETYTWPGGSGPNRSIVAFSAICAHKLSYPTKSASFINFRPEEITFTDRNNETKKKKGLIYCCSERSVYDPSTGAEVLGGPATQPLTTIVLEYDPDADEYYATATLGGELYDRFFESFGFRIALEHKTEDIRQLVDSVTRASSPEEYTDYQVLC